MKKINYALKVIETECECMKCHKKIIFKSQYFEPEDFNNMCPECYKETSKLKEEFVWDIGNVKMELRLK